MKRALYTPFLVCLLTLSACNDNSLPTSGQVEDRCALTLSFQPEGSISLQRANNNPLKTENGDVTAIGVCITGENHTAYQGTSTTRYTFNTYGTGYEGTSIPGNSSSPVTLYLTHVPATIQAFHPNTDVTEVSGNNYTIPVTHIPAEQTFTVATETATTGVGTLKCTGAMDYLYGSANDATGDATTITANNPNPSPTIYMHHALAKVVFTIKCDANRVVDSENDYVKSIKLSSSSGSPFLIAGDGTDGTGGTDAGTMQINNGTLALTSTTNELTFKPKAESDTQLIAAYSDPASTPNGIVACGLVAPLSTAPGNDITITVTLGKKGNDPTYDRQYSATATAFNVQWKKGMCYTYNLTLGNVLGSMSQTVSTNWNEIAPDDTPSVTPKEIGISSMEELMAFATLWNANGLPKKEDGTTDNYSIYEPYGWYETDASGKKVFTIKLTQSFKVKLAAKATWTPIGNDTHPLTIPIDGQGWRITFDLSGGAMAFSADSKYVGIMGYTKSSISNLRVLYPYFIDTNNYNTVNSGNATYVGTLAGKAEGDITNCTVEVGGSTLTSTPGTANENYYIGGLVGHCTGGIYNSAAYMANITGATATIQLVPTATVTAYMGGLAGKADKGVSNCYTNISDLEFDDTANTSSTVSAGWLVGTTDADTGAIFANDYYFAGQIASNITATTQGTKITEWANLCQDLNNNITTATPSWAQWTEKKEETTEGVTGKTIGVFLFNYRTGK